MTAITITVPPDVLRRIDALRQLDSSAARLGCAARSCSPSGRTITSSQPKWRPGGMLKPKQPWFSLRSLPIHIPGDEPRMLRTEAGFSLGGRRWAGRLFFVGQGCC
jgi:hypothetical protein